MPEALRVMRQKVIRTYVETELVFAV